MTTMTAAGTSRFRGKTFASARIHFANVRTGIIVPFGILAVILVANVALLVIILSQLDAKSRADAQNGLQYSGAAFYFIVYMIVFGVQAIAVTFPFALGWGVSRREYYTGTLLAILVRSVGFGAIFTILSLIESATGGWFVGGRMFTSVYFPEGPWWVRLIGFTALFLFVMVLGAAVTTVWVRWRGTGMLVLWLGLAVLVLIAVTIVTFTRQWGAVGQGLGNVIALPSAELWTLSLIPSVVLAALGWLVLRRAAPKV